MKFKNSKKCTKNDAIDEVLFKLAKEDYKPIPENIHNNILKTIQELEENDKNSVVTKPKKRFGFTFDLKEKVISLLSKPTKALAFSILSVVLVTSTAVGARNISEKFLNKDTVRLDNIGIANEFIFTDEMEDALVQNVPLNLIQLNDDYYIHVDSILVDEINFFTVFELHCKNGVTDDLRFTIRDLEISDENGKVLYSSNVEIRNVVTEGWKNIYNTENSIKELFFLLGNDNSKIKELNYSFSDIDIYKHIVKEDGSNSNFEDIHINFKDETIKLPITKNNYNTIQEYILEKDSSENTHNIEKAILTKTGLYITLKTPIKEINPLVKTDSKYYNMLYNLPLERTGLNNYLILLSYNIKNSPEVIQLYNNLDKNTYNLIQKN